MLEIIVDKTMKFSFWLLGSEVVTALACMLVLAL